MTSLYLMIPLGLVLSGLAIWLFVWALKGGQFEDLDSPGWSIIMDEEHILDEKDSDSGTSAHPDSDTHSLNEKES
ncbi:MAG: cbb3-type cytochrome oxidase assembly protein CcoS [Proteobacteria bacterium]|nr:cbb3-type cytochrome oxidase assembly protein CcoS [Pseudomonadota bacterium]